MTEPPNNQYNIPSSVPIASPPTYLLLIDSRVTNYQDIINAKQPGVHHIVFDVPMNRTYAKILFKSVEDKIATLGISAFTSVGLVQHNEATPVYEMFGPLANHIKPIVASVSSADPDLQSWNSISIFITMLHLTYGIQYFDMMACALYSNPDWKYIIDELSKKTGVIVRASTDDTGAAALGGDWFLESHTGVNLKSLYFTDAIDSYNGLLVDSSNTAEPSINTTKKLLLIDHLIPEIGVIINSINDDTYCLVFNSSYDTYDTILSKIRFLSGSNRYILDNFYYDASGSVSDTEPVLSPSILQTENNWPFYPESTAISVQTPVFFQRAKPGETMETIPYGSTTNEPTTVVSRYIPRDPVHITDLEEIYEIARTAGEVPSSDAERIHFDCVGILQHAALTNIGYKLTNMIPGQPAIIQNIQTLDANLSSWAHLGAFIERLKSAYHMTTLDLMACALYANPDWKYIIDNLAIQQNITVRASIDNTGTTNEGGNWILETAEINLTDVYFTDEIYKWSYILPSSVTALRFDGVNDGIDAGIPSWSNTTQFRQTLTVECWFKTSDTNAQKGTSGFISQWGTYNSTTPPNIGWVTRYKLHMLSDGRLDMWLETAGGWGNLESSLSYKDALWHHIAVSYNSSNGAIAMYIDGVLVRSATHTYPGILKDFGMWNAPIVIGSDYAGLYETRTDRQFRGLLSDIRIWNVVRSAAEISANYRQRLIGTETGLVGYWKLNHGNGTGWGSYSTALDSTSTRAHGTLVAAMFGATPSSSWVVSDISFNSRISTMTLGANNGVYNITDSSFSFIDPSSNSLGDFTYAISSGAVATISNGSATTKTVYATSGATVTIPTLSVYEFPELASLSSWQIDISFTATGGAGTYRGLVGDMYNSVNSRGWGLWLSSSNRIHWSWMGTTTEPSTISVNLNTAYVLTAAQSSGTITLTLRTVSTGAIQTGSFSNGANVMGKGPVTIGGWRNITGDIFPGTISYVNVSVPTNQRVVTLSAGTDGTPAIITASQTSFLDFAAGTKTASLTVNSNAVIPTISTWTIADASFGVSPFSLTPPTSNSTGAFSYISNTPLVATVTSQGVVTVVGAGSTTITALQAATTNYTGGSVTGVLVVSAIAPVITLSTITKIYGDASFNIQPSSTNTDVTGSNGDGLGGGLISFSSGNAGVVSIFDTSYVGIVGVGSAIITMSQTATTNFTSGSGTFMVTINKGTPVLSTFSVSSNRTYGSAPFSALAYPTSISNGAITYSSSDTNVATIDTSGVITLVGSGYVNFTASQASTAYYNTTTKTTNTMTVYRQALALTRASPSSSVINKIYGDSYFTVSATNASNGGAITYETDNTSVAGVINASTGVISVVSVGTATITARREQTAQYTSDPVSWTVEVARATTTLSGLSDVSYNVTSAPFTVSASSASNGAVTYSLQSPSSGVLTIHPTTGLVTLLAPGTAIIVASQAQGSLYLATASITATITVNSAGNALQGATLTSTSSFANLDLSGASLTGAIITANTLFTDAKLSNVNLTNAVITSANFTSANLSGATLAGSTITSATFTSASLKNADLSGATLTNTVFTGSDLSGARLTGVDASGASFANAKLTNVDMTGANIANVNFTNTSIKGANIADISFSPLQKLQLLKNSDNRDIGQIIIPAVSGTTILSAISETSPLRSIANIDLTSPSVSVSVVIPTTSTSPTAVLPDVILNVTDNDKFYLPINEGEYFQIEGVKYSTSEGVVRNYATNAVVEVINYGGKSVWLLSGSVVGLVLVTNSLNTASFVVPSHVVINNLTPFMPTTLPTSNSDSPIVYSSNNTYVATIDSSSGLITLTGHTGDVRFTATQVQNATYGPGTKSTNNMMVGANIDFSLTGLNQSFNLSTLALLDSSSVNMDATDATAVFYVRISDINNVFKYQTDSFDINNVNSGDIKYYVFHRKWPTDLKINPASAMMNKTESINMLGVGEGYMSNKSLLKHDFIRYISLHLFNTIYGVDLLSNESDIAENITYLGETVRHNIDGILSGISTTSSSETMSYDASGNKYLTNDSSGNMNLCRELMRQVAASAASRFYNNDGNDAGGAWLRNVPFLENDTITFKVIIQAAVGQNALTGVSEIPSRSYTIKLVMKNTVTNSVNTNTVIVDSEMYPNSYPYSSSVTTYAPTVDSSGVYNVYSPPAPIPLSRFGFNGWYYANTSAWVNVAPTVRNHVKWVLSANTGSSTVADLQYVRLNLKIHNNLSLPYLMIYTQAGSMRKYAVSGGNGSLTNGGVYSLYINFNSYTREPAMIGYTNAALVYTIGSGNFANNEVITSIAVETYGNSAAGNVEFTLASVVVGELSTTSGVTTEKEYGFEAAV